jgi:hypothetical protein
LISPWDLEFLGLLGGEAIKWESVARRLWPAPSQGPDIEAVLGSPKYLKGQGNSGSGMVLALDIRRGLLFRQKPKTL